MFQDKDCFERFAVLIVGAAILGVSAIGLPHVAAVGGVAVAATELWARVRGKTQSDAPKVVARLSAALRDEWDTWGKTSSHADDNLRASARASFEEVIDRLNLDPAALVGKRLNAQAVADLALSRAAAVFPEAYADTDPKNAEARLTRKFLHDVTLRAYEFLLNDAEFVNGIAPALWRGVLGQLDRVEADTHLLVKQMEKAIRDLALKEGMVIGIARRIAEGVDDFDTALRELERAIGIAARLERESKLPSNSGDQITRVLAELSRLNGENRLDDGASVVMDAFERLEAERARLIEIGLEQDILRRNVEGTAKWVVRRVLAEHAVGRFDALRAEQDRWYERGRDKGLNFDLEVSVHLARAALDHATNAADRGEAHNNLGISLKKLGEHLGQGEMLEEAASAYRAALTEWTLAEDRVNWAAAKNNLANLLRTLGERRGDENLLEQAIDAYRAVMMERSRKKVPLDWALAQNNLGLALQRLGERRNNQDLLNQAVTAYRAALTERTRSIVPLDWAVTQNNLGNALQILGQQTDDEGLLQQAISAYRASLTEATRERVPLVWSTTQNNLGAALAQLGSLRGSAYLLKRAVSTFRAALTERTKERVPLDWAASIANIGILELSIHNLTGETARLSSCRDAALDAMVVFRRLNATAYADQLAPVINEINRRLSAAP